MKNGSNMQWQKNSGYIYNNTNIGTISAVTVTSSAGTFTTNYGSAQQPTNNTTVGGSFFKTTVGNATGTTSSIVITFTITPTNPTITFDNTNIDAGQNIDLRTLFNSNSDGDVTYDITAGDSYAEIGSDGYTLTGSAAGSVTVRATQAAAGIYNGATVDATITVNAATKTLSSIAITTAPAKTIYGLGQTFDPTGMVVTASYDDSSESDVTASCTFEPNTALTADDDEITVSYTEGGVTKTAKQTIQVVDYAPLPFSYDGGKSNLPAGLTQSGLGTDGSSSPKMKFDNTGDYVVLKIAEAPGTLTYDIQGNSFSGGTFKLQSSIDGNSYIDIKAYKTLGTKQSETVTTLAPNVRYIRWIYTEKVNGNVALGNFNLAVKAAETGEDTSITIDASGITNTDVFVSNVGGFLTATVKNSSSVAIDGAKVQWESSNKNVATIGSDGSVTLIGAGSTTITATYLGKVGEYKSSDKTYAFEVTNSNPDAVGTINNPFTVAQVIAKYDSDGDTDGVYVKGIVSRLSGTISSGKQTYFISDDGTTNTEFEAYLGKGLAEADFTAETVVAVGDKVVITGDLTKYGTSTYELKANNYLVSMLKPLVAVGTDGWATYITTANVEFEPENAFVVQSAGTDVVLTPVTQVPSGTPLVLKGEGKKYVSTLASAPAAVTNSLAISDGAGEGTTGDYVLGKKNGVAGFYKWSGGNLSVNKVYLPASVVSTAREFLGFSFGDDDETTGVSEIKNQKQSVNGNIFDLQGRKVTNPTKGLYIVNGKKVVIK